MISPQKRAKANKVYLWTSVKNDILHIIISGKYVTVRDVGDETESIRKMF